MTDSFPHICAHRGLSLACPENTVPAFAAAVALGVHELELDLWPSRDGVPVVCHDPTVDRTTDGTGRIMDMDWEQLRALDAGIHLGEAWRGVRLPRFEQVIELLHGRTRLNIHIKNAGADGQLVRSVCDLLRLHGLVDRAYIAGDCKPVLAAAQRLGPDIERASLLVPGTPEQVVERARQFDCRRIQFSRAVTAAHTCAAHAEDIVCNLFWSDDPDEAREYVRAGVDVVLTNCADCLIEGGFGRLGSG